MGIVRLSSHDHLFIVNHHFQLIYIPKRNLFARDLLLLDFLQGDRRSFLEYGAMKAKHGNQYHCRHLQLIWAILGNRTKFRTWYICKSKTTIRQNDVIGWNSSSSMPTWVWKRAYLLSKAITTLGLVLQADWIDKSHIAVTVRAQRTSLVYCWVDIDEFVVPDEQKWWVSVAHVNFRHSFGHHSSSTHPILLQIGSYAP